MGRYIDLKEREKLAGKPTVLKDLNFLEMKKKIILGPEKGKLFLEQIKKDAEVWDFVFFFSFSSSPASDDFPPPLGGSLVFGSYEHHGLQSPLGYSLR